MGVVVEPKITGKLSLLRKRHFPAEIIAKPPPLFTGLHLHSAGIGKSAVNSGKQHNTKNYITHLSHLLSFQTTMSHYSKSSTGFQ
jgi:hypothetical protein